MDNLDGYLAAGNLDGEIDLADVPLSELSVTPAGRLAAIFGDPDLSPEAQDFLFAIVVWHDIAGGKERIAAA